jgi:hypothetical protein
MLLKFSANENSTQLKQLDGGSSLFCILKGTCDQTLQSQDKNFNQFDQ